MFHTKILVIGAEAPGITVCSYFMEHNFQDFILIGGKDKINQDLFRDESEISSKDFSNDCESFVTLGNNSKNASIGNVKFESFIFVDSSGHIIQHDKGKKLLDLLLSLIQKTEWDTENLSSLLSDPRLQKLLESYDEDILFNEELAIIQLFVEWLLRTRRLHHSGLREHFKYDSLDVESAGWNNDGKQCKQTTENIVSDSTNSVRQKFQENGKLHLDRDVIKITWGCKEQDRETDVEVVCGDGSVYIADIIIITVPLETLNPQGEITFIPPLPDRTKVILEGVTNSTFNKISLTFPYKWWPEDCHGLGLLWNKQAGYETEIVRNNETDWFEDVCYFTQDGANSNVLSCPVSQKMDKKTQCLSDDELCSEIMKLLNSFVGKVFDIPPPISFKRLQHVPKEFVSSFPTNIVCPVENSAGREVLLFSPQSINGFSSMKNTSETSWMIGDYALTLYRSKDADDNNFAHISRKDAHVYKVIIVGAGISGLAAAKTLIEGGINDIIILEAQEYAGGRICSVPVGESYLEAGAQWIHGENNEVYKLASHFDLLSEVVSAEGLGQYIRDDGVVLDTSIVFEVEHIVSDILKECESFVSKSNNVPLSIGHYLQQKFSTYLDSCTSDTPETRQMKEELFDWHLRFHVIDNSCTKLDTLSAKFWGKFIYCGGEDYLNFKQGYSSLIKCITQNFPDGLLKLRRPVIKVKWKTDALNDSDTIVNDSEGQTMYTLPEDARVRGVLIDSNKKRESKGQLNNENNVDKPTSKHHYVNIICEDGSLYYGEHVIITCSLGVLKRNYKTMFYPSLPTRKIQAIEEMGFSTICKIFLMYEEPWWSSETKGLQLIWSKSNMTKPSKGQASSWVRDLTGFDVVLTQKAVLLGWVGGIGAVMVEDLPEQVVGEHCTKLLREFTKRNDIPFPKTVYRTQWHNNRFVCGGYSNTSTACDISCTGPSLLLEPLYVSVETKPGLHLEHPALLFAGEAAHECYFSTTHGAYETGKYQAEFLLKYQMDTESLDVI